MDFIWRKTQYLRIPFVSLILLISVVVATPQQNKKPAAPAPAPKAAPPPKAQAPAARPPAAARPATTPNARPGTSATATRPNTATNARPGTSPGGPAKPGATTTAKTSPAGAKPSATTPAKTGPAGAKTTGPATTAKGGPATGAVKGSAATAKPAAVAAKPGTVAHPGGGKTVTTKSGNTKEFNKSGKVSSVSTKSGHEAKFDSHGRVTAIHTKGGATIVHGSHGERRVVGERVNARGEHYHVVNYGRGHGYVQHGYMRGGQPYMRRTYVYGGRSYAYAYRGSYYNGVAYYGYAPAYYYQPVYYGWAYNPWPAPVVYGWGWGAAPWYGYYGPYFAPAPVYPYASLWLADYLIAANLRLAYEAAAEADASASASPDYAPYMVPTGAAADGVTAYGGGMEFNADAAAAAMSPEIKNLVADEIKSQIEELKNSAANPAGDNATDAVPAALDPKHRVFVVSAPLDVTVDGESCTLSAGDIVQRQENQLGSDNAVAVKVLSSKSNDCAAGSTPRVLATDLQDMHNDFREKLDTGLDTLAKGGNGLPKAPDVTRKATPDGQVQPDLNVNDDLKAQEADAEGAEKEVKAASTEPDSQ